MKSSFINKSSIFFIVVLLSLSINSQEEKETNVLFVGNSFMFFWNMPQMIDAIGEKENLLLNIKQSTVSGSNLKQHWDSDRGTITRELLLKQKWDYVIIGDHSLSAIDHPERFKTYVKKFCELIRSNNAEPILYETWAYRDKPEMQDIISKSYSSIAEELNVKVIPVGTVLLEAIKTMPEVDFYFDNKHPSQNGSYLISLLIYKYLTNKSVKNIPNRITTLDKNGEKIYLSFIKRSTGNFLRDLVDQINFN